MMQITIRWEIPDGCIRSLEGVFKNGSREQLSSHQRATPLRISVAEFARIRAFAAVSPKSGDFGYIVLP